MTWPKKINILSTVYTIKYVSDPWPVGVDGEPGRQWGSFDAIKREIIIARQDDTSTLKTLLHEILHAVVWEMNISEIEDHEHEERIINSLAVGLADTLIRNKYII